VGTLHKQLVRLTELQKKIIKNKNDALLALDTLKCERSFCSSQIPSLWRRNSGCAFCNADKTIIWYFQFEATQALDLHLPANVTGWLQALTEVRELLAFSKGCPQRKG